MGNSENTNERDPIKDKIQDFLDRLSKIETNISTLHSGLIENKTKVSDTKKQLDTIYKGIIDITEKLSAYSTTKDIENKYLFADVNKLKEESKQLLENVISTKLFMGEYASIKTVVARLEREVAILKRDLEAHMEQYDTYKKNTSSETGSIRLADKISFKEHITGCAEWKKTVEDRLEEVKKNKYGFRGIIIFLSFITTIFAVVFGILKITDIIKENNRITISTLEEKQKSIDVLIKKLEKKIDE